jgi:hypothetical protein
MDLNTFLLRLFLPFLPVCLLTSPLLALKCNLPNTLIIASYLDDSPLPSFHLPLLPIPKPSDWLKSDEWLVEQQARVKKIWADAGRKYEAGQGVDPKVSVEKGKHQPEAAAKEKERQKAAGWDV